MTKGINRRTLLQSSLLGGALAIRPAAASQSESPVVETKGAVEVQHESVARR